MLLSFSRVSDIENRKSRAENQFNKDVIDFSNNVEEALKNQLILQEIYARFFNESAVISVPMFDELVTFNEKNFPTTVLYWAQMARNTSEVHSILKELQLEYPSEPVAWGEFNRSLGEIVNLTQSTRWPAYLVRRWPKPYVKGIFGFDLRHGSAPQRMFFEIENDVKQSIFLVNLSTFQNNLGAIVYTALQQPFNRTDIVGGLIDIHTILKELGNPFLSRGMCFVVENTPYGPCNIKADLQQVSVIRLGSYANLSLFFKASYGYTNILLQENLFILSIVFVAVQFVLYIIILLLFRDTIKSRILIETHRARFQARNQFVDYTFHELRVPLQVIQGTLDLLLLSNNVTTEERKTVRSSILTVAQMEVLLNNVLELSRIENGKEEYNDQWHRVDQIMQHVLVQFQHLCQMKSLEFKYDIDPQLKHVEFYVDQNRLKQAVANLLTNAIKYTNSYICFFIIKSKNSDGFSIMVLDNGPGIKPEDEHLLFKPYSQLNHISQASGTGLGLSIVRNTADYYNGTCSSTGNDGAMFLITFRPATRVIRSDENHINIHSEQFEHKHEQNIVSLQDLHVLLVEDNASNQIVTSTMLRALGARVSIANHGEEAVNMCLEDKTISIVLMDRTMPICNGLQATVRIRESGNQIPILGLTGNAREEQRKEFIDAGAQCVLTKPVSLHHLSKTLQKYSQL